jgi:hypothetical protein
MAENNNISILTQITLLYLNTVADVESVRRPIELKGELLDDFDEKLNGVLGGVRRVDNEVGASMKLLCRFNVHQYKSVGTTGI